MYTQIIAECFQQACRRAYLDDVYGKTYFYEKDHKRRKRNLKEVERREGLVQFYKVYRSTVKKQLRCAAILAKTIG